LGGAVDLGGARGDLVVAELTDRGPKGTLLVAERHRLHWTASLAHARTTEPSTYSFGDDKIAARRLDLVAHVFDEPSRLFVASVLDEPPSIAVDLGCGPGYTTRLLPEATGAAHVFGVDSSPAFLDAAWKTAGPHVEFVAHDVTRV